MCRDRKSVRGRDCVCVCVCERERASERKRAREKEKTTRKRTIKCFDNIYRTGN